MYHTTGLSKDDIIELCAAESNGEEARPWPSILGLFKSAVVTLTYLRRNHVQQELAEYHGVSQSTISRAITAITPLLATALRESGVLDGIDPRNWIGDKGYVGLDMITPIKKSAHRDLLDWEKEFNTAINRIRWKIEQTIANLKTWRILHTDYRRPLATFGETISAVIGLQFYRFSWITLNHQ